MLVITSYNGFETYNYRFGFIGFKGFVGVSGIWGGVPTAGEQM